MDNPSTTPVARIAPPRPGVPRRTFPELVARGLAEALHLERPDLTWEVTPLDRDGWTRNVDREEGS